MKYEIKENPEFKSVEVAFDGKPSEDVRNILKAMKFRWHSVKKVWYGYKTVDEVRDALEGKTAPKATKAVKKAEKVNKYGVKVGDVFYLNWGYDQTNVDYFQVVEIVGETSVRVKNVSPEIVDRENEGFMCGTYTHKITPEPMRVDEFSVFIKDNVHGDVKRVQTCGDVPYIRVGDGRGHMASKIPFGLRKEYISWYA